MAKAIVVDENDEVVGYKERPDWAESDIIRTTGLWITNTKGEVLLAQRSFNKKHDPGMWGVAAAGTVEEGESYDSNILKEAEEEIGLTGVQFVAKQKRLVQGAYRRIFIQTYQALADVPISEFKIEKAEVEALKWFTQEELRAKWEGDPNQFTKAFSIFVDLFLLPTKS